MRIRRERCGSGGINADQAGLNTGPVDSPWTNSARLGSNRVVPVQSSSSVNQSKHFPSDLESFGISSPVTDGVINLAGDSMFIAQIEISFPTVNPRSQHARMAPTAAGNVVPTNAVDWGKPFSSNSRITSYAAGVASSNERVGRSRSSRSFGDVRGTSAKVGCAGQSRGCGAGC